MKNNFSIRTEYDFATKTVQFFVGDDSKPIATLEVSKDTWTDIEFEQRVGYIVIAALSTCAGHSLGGRDYRNERNSAVPWILEHFKKRLSDGDETAIITLVHELVASAIRNSDSGEMNHAEQLLLEAAGAGNSQAIQYLENTWPRDKQDIINSIQRKSAS